MVPRYQSAEVNLGRWKSLGRQTPYVVGIGMPTVPYLNRTI
jgi:hypothetical protein